MEEKLTHIDENGRPRMVNVGEKADTHRIAVAKGSIYMQPATLARIKEGSIAKGDVLSVAQTAGIMAASREGGVVNGTLSKENNCSWIEDDETETDNARSSSVWEE